MTPAPVQIQPARGSRLALFESLFALHGFLFYTQVWWALVGSLPAILFIAIRYSILLGSLLLLLARWKTSTGLLARGGLLWLFLGFAVLSSLWSQYPATTLQGVIQIIVQISLFGAYIASRFELKHQLYILAVAHGAATLMSAVYAIALPSMGKHVDGAFIGAWKGIYNNKNELAGTMVMAVLIFYTLSFNNPDRLGRRIGRIGLGLCAGVVLLSTSKTALVVSVAIVLAMTLWKFYVWRGRRTVLMLDVLIFGSIFALVGIFGNWNTLVAGLGKDPTMSGRTIIWSGVLQQIWQRPWLGHGFDGFWIEENPAAMAVGTALNKGLIDSRFFAETSHNGFLEIALDLGFIGLGLFLLGYGITFWRSLRFAYQARGAGETWPLTLMLMLLLNNVTESLFLIENVSWIGYISVFLSVQIWPKQGLIAPRGAAADELKCLGRSPRPCDRATAGLLGSERLRLR